MYQPHTLCPHTHSAGHGPRHTAYGDSIYIASNAIAGAVRGINLPVAIERLNGRLNKARTSVEHAIGKSTMLWQNVENKRNTKLYADAAG